MHFHSHHDPLLNRRAHADSDGHAGLFMWGMTCFLLSVVSAIFTFVGTAGEPGGLWGRVATVGFLVLALVIIFIRRIHRNHR